MMPLQTSYRRIAGLNATDPRAPRTPEVGGPVGPDSMTAADAGEQAAALDQNKKQKLPDVLQSGYAAGGFEGLANSYSKATGQDWHDLPEWQRVQILDAART